MILPGRKPRVLPTAGKTNRRSLRAIRKVKNEIDLNFMFS
jgi:hypothetical protein